VSRKKYDHPAKPDPMTRGNDTGVLCIECYGPIHVRWVMVGQRRAEPDLRWVHTGLR
jgi:hypothetical protein